MYAGTLGQVVSVTPAFLAYVDVVLIGLCIVLPSMLAAAWLWWRLVGALTDRLFQVSDGRATASDSREGRTSMRKFMLSLAVSAIGMLVVAAAALAAPTVPAIPVSDYGDSLLSGLGSAVAQVFPYAAAVTVFAIGVGLVKRWLGSRKATRV